MTSFSLANRIITVWMFNRLDIISSPEPLGSQGELIGWP